MLKKALFLLLSIVRTATTTIVCAQDSHGKTADGISAFDYEATSYVIATKEDGHWHAEVGANDINQTWSDSDEFTYVNYTYDDMFELTEGNILIMDFPDIGIYENGSIASILFYNETKGEYASIYINFSETGKITVQNERELRHFPMVQEGEYIILELPSVWAKEYIEKAIAIGVVPEYLQTGYTYLINREDFCVIAYTALNKMGKLEAMNTTNTFTDVDSIEVESLAAAGIINGRSESTFAPFDEITREEAATILARMADFLEIPVNDDSSFLYNDDDIISDWAKNEVYKMQQLDIMVGMDNNIFAPKKNYTKEQAIATIMRLYDKCSN